MLAAMSNDYILLAWYARAKCLTEGVAPKSWPWIRDVSSSHARLRSAPAGKKNGHLRQGRLRAQRGSSSEMGGQLAQYGGRAQEQQTPLASDRLKVLVFSCFRVRTSLRLLLGPTLFLAIALAHASGDRLAIGLKYGKRPRSLALALGLLYKCAIAFAFGKQGQDRCAGCVKKARRRVVGTSGTPPCRPCVLDLSFSAVSVPLGS